MSKPLPDTLITPLSFEQRIQLVQAEIKTRVANQPATHRNHARARMWINWLKRNVLEVA